MEAAGKSLVELTEEIARLKKRNEEQAEALDQHRALLLWAVKGLSRSTNAGWLNSNTGRVASWSCGFDYNAWNERRKIREARRRIG